MPAGPRAEPARSLLRDRSASSEPRSVLAARALRGFADGLVSVLLAVYLTSLGLSPLQIGAIVAGTLVGSAVLTLAVGLFAHRVPARSLLLAACGLMCATGLGFAAATTFVPLLLIAFVGTLNPSAGDVSVFLPTEQAFLADKVAPARRPDLYARYNLGGALAGALGALASGFYDSRSMQRSGFLLYAAVGVVIAVIYRRLPRQDDLATAAAARAPLRRSRRIVLQLSALFSLDAAAGGLVVQSLLVLWLFLRFDVSTATAGSVFFVAGLLGACSQLVAARLASRIGLVRTMVFTHLPASGLLVAAAFAPRADVAIVLLLLRALCSQMDVPARQALVMAVVPPEERAAAASVTNVPRSLAAAATPLLAGLLLSRSHAGWPLLLAGAGKATYDLLLLARFGRMPVEAVQG